MKPFKNFALKTKKPATRCEICRQADLFEPSSKRCLLCTDMDQLDQLATIRGQLATIQKRDNQVPVVHLAGLLALLFVASLCMNFVERLSLVIRSSQNHYEILASFALLTGLIVFAVLSTPTVFHLVRRTTQRLMKDPWYSIDFNLENIAKLWPWDKSKENSPVSEGENRNGS